MNLKQIESFIGEHFSDKFDVVLEVLRNKEGVVSGATCGYFKSLSPPSHHFLVNSAKYREVSSFYLKASLLHEVGHAESNQSIICFAPSVAREVAAQKWAIEYASRNKFPEIKGALFDLLEVWKNQDCKNGKSIHTLAYEEIMSCRN